VALVAVVVEIRARAESSASVSPQEAILLMNRGALAIDLRAANEFAAGHVPGARRMDGAQILKAADVLKKQQNKPLIVCCKSGSLASAAVRQLREQGFTQAVALRGGLAAWQSEQLPMEKQADSAA
jgi:rhodanese-related sulfurtransferase